MNNKKILEMISKEIKEELEQNTLMLWDIELIKEGASQILRIYIDKQNKDERIDVSECELISRKVSQFLDETDPIKEAYMLEVSSPGINRQLRKEEEYNRYIGHMVDVKLYSKMHGAKEHTGQLLAFEGDKIRIQGVACKAKEELVLELKDIASTRLAILI
ncbi:MAG: ribosome maturation factor RimP [Defluviitaleaceae bacterium]|nr:ribosome maturation factor RimP [Defluviitaleaceae bacterium]